MCYAIPGKIVSLDGNIATIDYFGEYRKAQIIGNQNLGLKPGDYIYAQGGVIVGKVNKKQALETLEIWKKQFFELKKIDEKLSEPAHMEKTDIVPILKKAEQNYILTFTEIKKIIENTEKDSLQSIYQTANSIRKNKIDNACCVHGIIEFSNYCESNCFYCGLRCANKKIKRYRMNENEILDAVDYAVNELGFKALVLQSGEDSHYTDKMLVELVKKIREKHGILIFISIGERSIECYKQLYQAGAYGALLRFETSNKHIYSQIRPGKKLENRLALIKELKKIGFVLATGFLIGLPGETTQDKINNILLTKNINPDMYSFGPLIPHSETPLSHSKKPSISEVLKIIAVSRFVDNQSKILVTTALETLDNNARKLGLLSGANSLMIDITPEKYMQLYDIYPGKTKSSKLKEEIKNTIELLHSLGRAPTDLGV